MDKQGFSQAGSHHQQLTAAAVSWGSRAPPLALVNPRPPKDGSSVWNDSSHLGCVFTKRQLECLKTHAVAGSTGKGCRLSQHLMAYSGRPMKELHHAKDSMVRKLCNVPDGTANAEPAERDSVDCACIHHRLLA